jgi:hypothetical protein
MRTQLKPDYYRAVCAYVSTHVLVADFAAAGGKIRNQHKYICELP